MTLIEGAIEIVVPLVVVVMALWSYRWDRPGAQPPRWWRDL